ncbi:hypothetical protein GCM10007870_02630 [Gluconobacter kondonii]|uniref:Integrase n=2 Tax=Gluconobacter kondonii TaxID=941463 RepID=A0ABQ5WPN9_9PROT|nr:hypothetical protein AA3266_0304 [Gluconobacter kondonii NBRC 3266]GLQ64679.1 hypothetical protein GCM10007870_02630 [Gluconobacter kondonii]
MHLEQRTGPVPGLVYATVRQGMTTRTFPIEVRRTASGHYISRMPDNRWSIECLTIEAALLMHAAVLFPIEQELSPWLSNPKPAPSAIRHAAGPIKSPIADGQGTYQKAPKSLKPKTEVSS